MSTADLPDTLAAQNPLTTPTSTHSPRRTVAVKRQPPIEQPSHREARPGHRDRASDRPAGLPVRTVRTVRTGRGPQAGGDATPSPYAERRAETMRMFEKMHELAPSDPERERLRRAIIEDHMPFARYAASRYGGRGESVEDVVQVAYLGLVKAADNFDPYYGTGFLGYATPMMVGEIKRYFRDSTWDVHVPRRMQELSGPLRNATEALAQDLSRAPTLVELAGKLSADPKQIAEALRAAEAYTAGSLDHPVRADRGDGRATLADFLGVEDPRFDAVVDREALRPLLAALGERDKRILLMRFFRGLTQSEIGKQLNVSQMQVSRELTRILGRLRAGLA